MVMTREQMLTVPCVATCHDLKEDADHTWGNGLPLILRHFRVKGSLPVRKTCLKDTEGLNGGQTFMFSREKKKEKKKSNMQIV